MLQGVEGPLPPLKGFVMTTVKDSPLVEVAMRSPDPDDPENSTVLASWTYGLGRTVAFTSDTGYKWANAWESWAHYDKLFSQMVRWSMRPLGDTGKFTVATDHRDGRVKVTITALDNNDEFLNFLTISGASQVKAAQGAQSTRNEYWKWLLGVGLLVLVFEWYVYNRRVYL